LHYNIIVKDPSWVLGKANNWGVSGWFYCSRYNYNR